MKLNFAIFLSLIKEIFADHEILQIARTKTQSHCRPDGGREFDEWDSLFSSEVFVKLVAYADESHSGKDDSEVLIIAGWIALRDEWSEFCDQWGKVLKKYDADYFHFREWSDASSVARGKRHASAEFKKKNPYKHLDQIRLDAFLIELAKIAASGNKLIVGGYVPQNQFIKDKGTGLAACLT